MSLNAATIEMLIAKGLSAGDILDVARATEVKADRTNAERQARYRARKRNAVTVTGVSPNEVSSIPGVATEAEASSATQHARSKPDPFPCPDGVDEVDWEGLKANRKTKRAALSAGAHRGILRKLAQFADSGWPPGPIVAHAAERGWTTVFETDEMKAGQRQNGRSANTLGRHQPSDGLSATTRAAERVFGVPFGAGDQPTVPQ